LYNFKLIPYLYDVFKPLLVTHAVLTDEAYIMTDMADQYFDINYEYYWLNIARLAQALAVMAVGSFFVILANGLVALAYCATSKDSSAGKYLGETLAQFKFNAYIRYYMICYFDLTFFAIMKLVDASEGNDTTPGRRGATIASYVIFTLSMVVPVFLVSVVCFRFDVMRIKQAKAAWNTLVLKVDKQSRWRLVVPFYFFFRRIITACLLAIPIENTFIFLQYVFVLMSSHSYVLYLVAVKPYQTTLFNNYVLANETFYSALIIAIFIFSDATPELHIKIGAAIVLIVSVNAMILANFVMVCAVVCKGKATLKDEIKQAKLRRAERELMEEEEEEERRQRQQKEEEEFTKLPDDATDLAALDAKADEDEKLAADGSKKRRKKRKDKNKNDNDELSEYTAGGTTLGNTTQGGNTSEMGNTTSGMLNETSDALRDDKKRKKDKKKKRRDKNKGKHDEIAEAPIAEEADEPEQPTKKGAKTKGSTDDPSGSSSSDKKKKKKTKKHDEDEDGDRDLI
jgi:hypothetical protein